MDNNVLYDRNKLAELIDTYNWGIAICIIKTCVTNIHRQSNLRLISACSHSYFIVIHCADCLFPINIISHDRVWGHFFFLISQKNQIHIILRLSLCMYSGSVYVYSDCRFYFVFGKRHMLFHISNTNA